MSKADNLHDFLQDVSDAIKEKKGSSEPINAQSFSEEIRNIPSGSPFAVDFGEEIASGNPTFINALQEDIDYYNEVQRKRAAGEVTDVQLQRDYNFKKKIAWIPPDMDKNMGFEGFCSLIEISDVKKKGYAANTFRNCQRLESAKNLDLTEVTNALQTFENSGIKEFDVELPLSTNVATFCQHCHRLRKARLVAPVATTFNNAFMFCDSLDEVEVVMNEATKVVNMFTYSSNYLKNVRIYGLKVSLSLSSAEHLTSQSIHHIISNAATASSSITLTFHATAKANWEASEYYAEDVVTANEKNITIA